MKILMTLPFLGLHHEMIIFDETNLLCEKCARDILESHITRILAPPSETFLRGEAACMVMTENRRVAGQGRAIEVHVRRGLPCDSRDGKSPRERVWSRRRPRTGSVLLASRRLLTWFRQISHACHCSLFRGRRLGGMGSRSSARQLPMGTGVRIRKPWRMGKKPGICLEHTCDSIKANAAGTHILESAVRLLDRLLRNGGRRRGEDKVSLCDRRDRERFARSARIDQCERHPRRRVRVLR
jgi:hypothetical protein